MRTLVTIAAALAIAGCQPAPQIHVDEAWVRLPAAPGRPAAAYFRLHGGETDATLIQVTSSVAIKTELHETARQGSHSVMRPIGQVALPAEKTVPFAPGGKHVMLFDLNPSVRPGAGVPLRFTFADGLQIEYNARAVAAGDPPPKF